MLHTAEKNQTVSLKHLIDLRVQAGLAVIIDGKFHSLSDLLAINKGLYSVVNTTIDSITVNSLDETI